MDAAVNNQPCNCELCQPNWHLGRDGEFERAPETVEKNSTAFTPEHLLAHFRRIEAEFEFVIG
jgi:hypothetical protein